MTAFALIPGLVIRYDFLWKNEYDAGREHGAKDRPCAIVLVTKPRADGTKLVVVCPITHTPPDDPASAVEIPPRVARHLELDHQRSWIRTHEVNTFTWENNRIPAGVTKAGKDRWAFGELPYRLATEAFDQVAARSRDKTVTRVDRDNGRE